MEALKAAQAREEEAARAREPDPAVDKTGITEYTEAETTYTTNVTTVSSQASTKPGKKKVAKAKMTAKEKKERLVSLSILCVRP